MVSLGSNPLSGNYKVVYKCFFITLLVLIQFSFNFYEELHNYILSLKSKRMVPFSGRLCVEVEGACVP